MSSLRFAMTGRVRSGSYGATASAFRTEAPRAASDTTDCMAKAELALEREYEKGAKDSAEDPDGPLDCSGLVEYVYPALGAGSSQQAAKDVGTKIDQGSLNQYVNDGTLTAGDVLFFDTNGDGTVDHTGIYAGNGEMIHASEKAGKVIRVTLSNWSKWEEYFYSARRVPCDPKAKVLTLTIVGPGSVTLSPSGEVCQGPKTCAFDFSNPGFVQLQVQPNVDSEFGGWGGACSGTGNCVLDVSSDKAATATFTQGCVKCEFTGTFTAVSHQGFGWTHTHTIEASLSLANPSFRFVALTITAVGVADDPNNPYSPSYYGPTSCVIQLSVTGGSMTGKRFPCEYANTEGIFNASIGLDANGAKTVTGTWRLHNLFVEPWTLPGYAEDTGNVAFTLK